LGLVPEAHRAVVPWTPVLFHAFVSFQEKCGDNCPIERLEGPDNLDFLFYGRLYSVSGEQPIVPHELRMIVFT
jgi:hypothetical protein